MLLTVLLFLPLISVQAQTQQIRFEQGQSAYSNADFDGAITFFQDVAKDNEAPIELRREAMKYLGRVYIAQSAYDEARKVVNDLLELEPPLVELNPDHEPPPLMELYYEVRKEYEGSYAVEKADPGMRTLAIVDFTNNSIDEHEKFDPMRQGFASMMINYMGGATDLKVVERERLEWILKELELQKTQGIVDQSTAVRTGKLLGAHAVVFGSYTVHRKKLYLSARMVKVETGEILLAEQIDGKRDDFFELVQDLSFQLAKAVNSTVEKTTLGSRVETKSLDAELSYSEGLGELDKGNYHAAQEKFREALEYDPNYQRAKDRLQSIQPMLAQASASGGASSGG